MPRTVAGCAPTPRKPAKASAAARLSAHSTSTATATGPTRNTPITTTASSTPVSVANETLEDGLCRTARPASGFTAGRRVRSGRAGAGRGASSITSSTSVASSANSHGRASDSLRSPARNDASNWSSWATQSASPSRHAGAGIAAHGSSLVAVSRATTIGTWPVGASVQCGRSVASSYSGVSSTRSAATSAPVMVTRESVALTTGISPVGSLVSSSDFKKFLLLVCEQRVHCRHFVLGHLVESLF